MCCRSAASSPPAPSASPEPRSPPQQRPKSTICCRVSPASTVAPTCNRNRAPRARLMSETASPRQASTVLLLRDSKAASEIEVFMMVRHHQIEFNSGALVFPGGSVDKNDREIAANPALRSEEHTS